ncbi:TRIC cation channel family protein [Sphingomonas cannabina]|uniref:trimeric intracellular cation channel family protein n=1 Tax=Sphingomonas cannabina TaxID=2899123 RepID=UPI001F2E1D81|nr:TRIC cation channel family protein [Sphingomonas cannabina]UIJ44181.1 TRIC cation channel family protein [Sphingomonas cannabina]
MTSISGTAAIVCVADLAGTFVFAVEGALIAIGAGFDPVGIVTLAFATALGGGVIRDLLIGIRPAAVADWRYGMIVLGAAIATIVLHPLAGTLPTWIMIVLDAAGLGLFAVAGTEKALDHGVHPLPAAFLGTVGGVGGGAIRDILLNAVPRILHVDIYASAAFLAAVIVVLGRSAGANARIVALLAGSACFLLRVVAVALAWQLPRFT